MLAHAHTSPITDRLQHTGSYSVIVGLGDVQGFVLQKNNMLTA